MSRADKRDALLEKLAVAGRRQSDAAVMYHSTLADRLQISASEWKILGILDQRGPLTAGQISEHSGLAPASVTGILDRLEERSWIHRTRDSQDRRRIIVTLDAEVTAERFGFLFEGLWRRLTTVYEQYSDQQLELIHEVLQQLANVQLQATQELQSSEAGSGGD